ncbi:MAG: CBS domain-containing protein, partial [Paludibacterium sp.]|uniref:CBS domain-containing protein n=1 Tax=Paludibacterium sp. TaxID=1917523 RepID=UPI0025FD01EA
MMSILFQPVTRIMSTEILLGSPGMLVRDAAQRMSERRCSTILVVDASDRAIGIWTETDAVRPELFDAGMSPLCLADVMSSPVVCVTPTTTIQDAVVMFHDKSIRHALVADDGVPLGMLSMSDIIRHQDSDDFLGLRRLDTVPMPSPCILDGTLDVREAVTQMRAQGRDAVVVRLSAATYGILTQRDVVRLMAQGLPAGPLASVCSRSLKAVSGSTRLADARNLLLAHQIRHLGVLDD